MLGSVDLLQVNTNRVLPRFIDSDVANSVRREVGMAVLVVGDLVFAIEQTCKSVGVAKATQAEQDKQMKQNAAAFVSHSPFV